MSFASPGDSYQESFLGHKLHQAVVVGREESSLCGHRVHMATGRQKENSGEEALHSHLVGENEG